MPIQVPPHRFTTVSDGTDFIVWIGEDVSDVALIRADARRWSGGVRDWLCCPTCDTGRVEPGHAQCEPCEADLEFDRNHLRLVGSAAE